MKLSKKAITALSFTLGASLFISTAFADTLLGSGYDRLKGSAKITAAQMEKGLNNYTIDSLLTLKSNNQILFQTTNSQKFDTIKQATEETDVTQQSDGKTSTRYSYSDNKQVVRKNGADNKYYVTEYPDDAAKVSRNMFTNPFNETGAPEIEKIVDALVGGLKDYVQVEERADGSKAYSGSLSEAQVPAVVNAVSSFGIQQLIREQGRMERNSKMTEIESDIFVKKVTGTAIENKAGILENVTGDVFLSGKDKSGAQHDLAISVVFKLSGIGTTKVASPDLTGAEVETVNQSGGITSKYVGTYKNNIIIEKDGKLVKIGERTFEIKSVENGKVAGKYSETVKPGFEANYPDKYDFNFEYNPSSTKSLSTFTYKNAKGEQENGQVHENGPGKIYVDLNIEIMNNNSYRSSNRPNFDGQFSRVFDE